MSEERTLALRIALIGAGAGLLGGLIGVVGSLVATERTADRAHQEEVRDVRAELYEEVLAFEHAILDQPILELGDALRAIDEAAAAGKPLPSPRPSIDSSEYKLAVGREITDQEPQSRRLRARLELYGSEEALALFDAFMEARFEEVTKSRKVGVQGMSDANLRFTFVARQELIGD